MNSVKMSSPSELDIKSTNVESIMVSCIDNEGMNYTKSATIMCRLITPELSLNRLFEAAKEENLKMAKFDR